MNIIQMGVSFATTTAQDGVRYIMWMCKKRMNQMSKIICQCGDAIQPDDDALCGTCAMDFHDNKRTIERLKRENANLKTEIAKLQADNRSLVEQMNKMALEMGGKQ